MSGYHLPSALPTPYDLPLPVGVESPRRGPIPLTSTEHNLQQPFENWSLRAPYELPGSSTAAGPYRTDSVMQNEFAYHPPIPQPRPQATPNGGQPASGWGLPRGAMLHVPPGIPDEMLPKQIAPGSELVKVTGKSCASCRARKVKCDRRYPDCTRCLKRKEVCEYGNDVSFALRAVVRLDRPQGNDSPDSSDSSRQFFSEDTLAHTHQRMPSSSLALPYPPRRLSPDTDPVPSRSLRTVSDFRHQLARRGAVQHQIDPEDERAEDRQPGFQQLWDRFLDQSNLGESSCDWRLALPTMASSLTLHLLDASMNSCCYHLPAFHVFNPSIAFYKQNLNSLDVASQAAVGILASLGARASPHSALLGVAGPDIENGNASHELVLSAGVRRENAWRAIVKQATELCSKLEVLQVPSAMNAQTLVAFVHMLMFSEVKPKTARFFLRAALGLFYDMQGGELSEAEVYRIKQSVGVPLFESDARISAWLSMPALISEDDLYDYFDGTGVHLVDLEREDLSQQLVDLFDASRGPITADKADEALRTTGFYVCAVQRLFAKISSNRRSTPTRFLSSIEQLWGYIDAAHSACQLLTGTLREFAMAQNDPHHSAHHDLLIGLRMHERLLDIMNLSNEWLRSKRDDALSPADRNALEGVLGVSNRRVRRCLKVLAFYAKVFHDSHDKHVVYHLFTQLEAVEGWASMAAQGADEVDEFGPIGSQCVLTETELDYFSQALELACFYTPLSAQRLDEFTRARRLRYQRTTRFAQISEFELPGSGALVNDTLASHGSTIPPAGMNRFSELSTQQAPRSMIPAINVPYEPNTSTSFDTTTNAESLSSWVLSSFAVTPNETTLVDGESPTTSSLSVSPGRLVEPDSSPDTNPSAFDPMSLAPTPTASIARRDSNKASQTPSDSFAYSANDFPDVAFPASTLTNLIPQHPSLYRNLPAEFVGNVNGATRSVFVPSGTNVPRQYSDDAALEGLDWSEFSNWKQHQVKDAPGNGLETRPA
ncbi:hypothetical protein JCM3766R1_003094 [Sporobolomyces carnicolor]